MAATSGVRVTNAQGRIPARYEQKGHGSQVGIWMPDACVMSSTIAGRECGRNSNQNAVVAGFVIGTANILNHMRDSDSAADQGTDSSTTDQDALAAWLADWQPGQAPVVPPIPGYNPPPVAETPAPVPAAAPALRPVFNLTGTVLHPQLGRAPLPTTAVDAILRAALAPVNLGLDLTSGATVDRDLHLERLLCQLTAAEAAMVVNNNAAAMLLVVNTFARRKEVATSRGELLEIGETLRVPDLIGRAAGKLREIGTTNRTRLTDYAEAIGPRTGIVFRVHASGYASRGCTSTVGVRELAGLCRDRGVPLAVDLGSGALLDLRTFGLPYEPTPAGALAAGADLVLFSGDKLLGGPQAGVIVGRADLIAKTRRNALARALRIDKLALAALGAALAVYLEPARLTERLPVLRALRRPQRDIQALAERLQPVMTAALGPTADVTIAECATEIGAGVMPTFEVPSVGVAIVPSRRAGEERRGRARVTVAALTRVADAFRALPVPVIGRVRDGAFVLDLRCLEDERGFVEQLARLDTSAIMA